MEQLDRRYIKFHDFKFYPKHFPNGEDFGTIVLLYEDNINSHTWFLYLKDGSIYHCQHYQYEKNSKTGEQECIVSDNNYPKFFECFETEPFNRWFPDY